MSRVIWIHFCSGSNKALNSSCFLLLGESKLEFQIFPSRSQVLLGVPGTPRRNCQLYVEMRLAQPWQGCKVVTPPQYSLTEKAVAPGKKRVTLTIYCAAGPLPLSALFQEHPLEQRETPLPLSSCAQTAGHNWFASSHHLGAYLLFEDQGLET